MAELKPAELIAKAREHPELRDQIRAAVWREQIPVRDKLFDVKRVVDAREAAEAMESPREVRRAHELALLTQEAETVFFAARDLEKLADGDVESAKRSAALLTSYS